MKNSEYVQIFKQYEVFDTEYLNAVAEFAVQFDIETTDAIKIAHECKTRKNASIRVYKNKRGLVAAKRITVSYDGKGYLGSFRSGVDFNFNDNNKCYAVYGL